MKESGRVIAREGARIQVELQTQSACRTCGASFICRGRGETRCVWAKDSTGAQIGDTVTLELSEGRAILLSFLLFIVPLMLLALVYGILEALLDSELWSIVPALLVALGYFLVLRRTKASKSFAARVTRLS